MYSDDDKPYDSPEFTVPDYIEHTDGIDYAVTTYRDDDENWVYCTKDGKEIVENEVWASGHGLKAEYDLNYAPKDPRPIKYHVITEYQYDGNTQVVTVNCYTDVELRQALADARQVLSHRTLRRHTIATIKRILSVGNSGVQKWLYYRANTGTFRDLCYTVTIQTNYEVKS